MTQKTFKVSPLADEVKRFNKVYDNYIFSLTSSDADLNFNFCVFKNCKFTGYTEINAKNCLFENCTFGELWREENFKLFKCQFNSCQFNSKIGNIKDCTFSNCKTAIGNFIIDKQTYLRQNFETTGNGIIVYKTFGEWKPVPKNWIRKKGSIITHDHDKDESIDCSFGINVSPCIRYRCIDRCWSILLEEIYMPDATDDGVRIVWCCSRVEHK